MPDAKPDHQYVISFFELSYNERTLIVFDLIESCRQKEKEYFKGSLNAFKNVADICLPPLLHCLRIILDLMTMWNSADLSNWGFSLIWFRYIELSK